VIHRTYRSLDAPIKLVGFTLRQWVGIIAGSVAVIGLVALAHLPTRAAISLCTLVIGVPVAITYVSETGGLQLSILLRDGWRWRTRATQLPARCPTRARTPGVLIDPSARRHVIEAVRDVDQPETGDGLAATEWVQ
jgi:hypothetical protein